MSATINCVFLGAPGVGKTSFFYRHSTGQFFAQPPEKSGPASLTFNSNQGKITFAIWDKDLPAEADCALLFFSVTDSESYRKTKEIYEAQTETFGLIPTILCGNKVDQKFREVKPRQIRFHKEVGITYCDISAKSCFNYDKPFLYLARQVLQSPGLIFAGPRIQDLESSIELGLRTEF